MNILDMRTIIFTTLITHGICTMIIVLMWHRNRQRYDGLFFNVLDFFCQAVAMVVLFNRSSQPHWYTIVATNALLLCGTFFGFIGLEKFTGKSGRQFHNVLLICVFTGVHTWFSLIQPDQNMRNLNLSAFWLIIGLQVFWLLVFRVEAEMRSVTLGVGLVYGAMNLTNLARVVHALSEGSVGQDWMHSGPFETYIMLFYKLIVISLTYALVLMVNKRLLMDVETQEDKFSMAFHSSPYGIMLTRAEDGRIFEVNEGYAKMSGYLPEEMIGRTTMGLNLWLSESERDAFIREIAAKGSVHDFEVTMRRKSGEFRTILLSSEKLAIHGQDSLLSTISDITFRKQAEAEREKLIRELQEALTNVKTLSGLLPICSACKKIRNDKGYWEHIEEYIAKHSGADFSHGICPECAKKMYPEVFNKK